MFVLNSTPEVTATVAICTCNGAARIGRVIEALAAQNLPSVEWETLVIDNASSDGTGPLADELMRRLLPSAGRVVREETAGLTFARRRAATEARGNILCFLDDDNIPAPDFVANAIRAFAERPQAVAMGGKVKAVWEQPPSALALAVQDFALAICDRGNRPFCYERNVGPVGAGLCVRRDALRRIYQLEDTTAIPGRTGANLASGDDIAIGVLAWNLGGECWYEPSLQVNHLLAARRMQKDYLLRLYEGIGRGQASVRRLYDWKARNPFLALLLGAKDLGRWFRGRILGPPENLSAREQLVRELHELEQRLVWGRAMEALTKL